MKRDVDAAAIIRRSARLGVLTAIMTLLSLWIVGALIRYEVLGVATAEYLIAASAVISAFTAQSIDRTKGKGILSALLGTVVFLALLYIIGISIPKTEIKNTALLLTGGEALIGSLAALLLHFHKRDRQSKIRG